MSREKKSRRPLLDSSAKIRSPEDNETAHLDGVGVVNVFDGFLAVFPLPLVDFHNSVGSEKPKAPNSLHNTFDCFRSSNSNAPLHMDVEHVYFPLMGTRDHSWEKIRRVFRYINDTVLNQYDWFLRADDDAYVIVDNARSLASNYDPNKPLVLGFRWGFVEPRGYIDGGVYILSREAVTTFNRLMIDNSMCPDGHIAEEDQEISRCMAKVGIYPTDTRDQKGRERFHHFHVDEFKDIWLTEFIKQNAFYGFKNFPKGISDSSVSFHHLSPYEMRIVDYLVRKLNVGNPLAALDSIKRPAFLDYFSRSPK